MSAVAMHGSLTVGPYKGYYGLADYDTDAKSFHGEVVGTKDVITFVGASGAEIETAFAESVDDYLEFCQERGEAPEKPHSGRLLVRIPPKLHYDLFVASTIAGVSLNQHITTILAGSAKPAPLVSALPGSTPIGQQFSFSLDGFTVASHPALVGQGTSHGVSYFSGPPPVTEPIMNRLENFIPAARRRVG